MLLKHQELMLKASQPDKAFSRTVTKNHTMFLTTEYPDILLSVLLSGFVDVGIFVSK